MSSRKAQLILMGLALVSTLAVPQAAPARGGGGGGGHVGAMGGFSGGMMGGGMSMPMGASFGGGAPFGNAMGGTRVVTPSSFPFSNFPFFGGGDDDFYGGYPTISQPFLEPPPVLPPPEQVMGPMGVQVMLPVAQPIATGTRTVFVDGLPTTVTGPIVTEYHWPLQESNHDRSMALRE